MSIEIKKVYLENYKLFTTKEIEFSEYLSVFDGPNGYGKTSIFDAIEFLITGSISRIQESDLIAANISYSQNCLAKDSKKDMRLKAEFKVHNSENNIVIALRIPASTGTTKQNNPKNIESQTELFVLPQYDIPVENWEDYHVSTEEISTKRNDFFGEQNIKLFKMLHYIHQEDRLAYFKKSEIERSKTITDLFGIEEDIYKLAKLNEAQRQLSTKVKTLQTDIEKTETELQTLSKSEYNDVAYESIFGGKHIWDKEILGFNGPPSKPLFEQIKGQIRDISAFIKNKTWYFVSAAVQRFERIPQGEQSYAIMGWILSKNSDDVLDIIRKNKGTLDFLTKQSELLNNNDFVNADWKKLCFTLECGDSLETILGYVEDLKRAQQNQSDLNQLANSLYQARETLKQRNKQIETLDKGLCPYCGFQWENESQLQAQFASTKPLLENLLGDGNIIYDQAVQRCQKYYKDICQGKLEEHIKALHNNFGVQLLSAFNSYKEFRSSIDNCDSILNYLSTSHYKYVLENSAISDIDQTGDVISEIIKIKESIPSNYDAVSAEHEFDKVYNDCFSDNTYLDSLTIDQLKNKEKYIEAQYYTSFNQARQNLELLKIQEGKLSSLHNEIKKYHSALKKSIDAYQQLVIKQIEIPFFLYCSRLLQSYQGGQGVLIESKDSKIRFTAPGAEHDVLYTMSSGQLSAVLLAFSLVLNKIYSGEKFCTLLIDDPIQCMDDINMISFVELLRREFSDSQIILSTHEDTFANYIKYKFSKYNLKSQSITLKNDK